MCRIAGIFDFNNSLGENLEQIVVSMRDSMAHGGPDDAGVFVDRDKGIALANRRLSIIDLSANGHQPMSNHEGSVWITYNGEIYNFEELRKELKKHGCQFKSRTDTEVLIYGYEEWGIEGLLSRLRGMFAFAIYDKRGSSFKLVLARDRFGIKPLYYYHDKDKFIFSSEVKAFEISGLVKANLNTGALVNFLQLGSIPPPLTSIKNVYSLSSGHYMVVQKNNIEIKQYWDILNYFKSYSEKSSDEATKQIRDLLYDTVKLHLISDAPLGIFLSGGIDSSSLVAVASKYTGVPLRTLSIVFDEDKYNEALYSREIAEIFKTDHREILLKQADFINEIPEIFEAMDQPSVDGVNTYFVSKAAKETGLKAVLSGIGGDEVFLGYNYFKNINALDFSQKFLSFLPIYFRKALLNSCMNMERILGLKVHEKLDYMVNPTTLNNYLLFRGLFTPREIQGLLGINKSELDESSIFSDSLYKKDSFVQDLPLVQTINYLDFNHYLHDQLLKDADYMGMRHSVEIRVPFVDHLLVENVLKLSPEIKLANGINKPLLVKSLINDLPKSIYNRKKMGFVFPFGDWIKNDLGNFADILQSSDTFDRGAVKELFNSFRKGKLHWSRIWALVVGSKIMSPMMMKKH